MTTLTQTWRQCRCGAYYTSHITSGFWADRQCGTCIDRDLRDSHTDPEYGPYLVQQLVKDLQVVVEEQVRAPYWERIR